MAPRQAKLVLGTVQIGIPYGAANVSGLPPIDEAVALLRTASESGIDTFDTARAYGDAERRIGLALNAVAHATVITKLDPLTSVSPSASEADVEAAAAASLAASRAALRRARLDVVLLHRAAHRVAWNGAAWQRLRREWREDGIARIGVSAQTPQEALDALADRDVTHVQLPFNILDHRWDLPSLQAAIRARPEVTIHVRSVFLQGLLAGTVEAGWPRIPGAEPAELRRHLVELQRRFGRASLADLCVAFVRGQDWIDGVVIGMEHMDQLRHNLALFQGPPLQAHEVAGVRAARTALPDAFLDPAQWPPAAGR